MGAVGSPGLRAAPWNLIRFGLPRPMHRLGRQLSLVAAAVVVLVVSASVCSPSAHAGRHPRVLLVGDSLAAGMSASLQEAIPRWRLSTDARVGRSVEEGLARLATHARAELLAVSLFTNDDPRRVRQLDSAVRHTLRAVGPHGCVVWATIARPAVAGVDYDAANRRLEQRAREEARLRVVPWARATRAHPDWLTGDRVHPDAAGYARRALLYARALRSCPNG